MSDNEILQEIQVDEKKVNKLRKKLGHAYYWKRAAWRALWPLAYTEFSAMHTLLRLIGVLRVLVYVLVFVFLYEALDNTTLALVVFGAYYFLRFGIFMFLAQRRINKVTAELREFESKYGKIKEDYVRDSFERQSIVTGEGSYKHRGSNGIDTLVRDQRMYLYGQLDDSYGEIQIIPVNQSAEVLGDAQKVKYLDHSVDAQIASIDFKKRYNVYTDKNNQNRCFAYLSPTIIKAYIDWAEESKNVRVYTIRGKEMEITMNGIYDTGCFYESVALIEYDKVEDKIDNLYSNFKQKVSIYDRYFRDAVYLIGEIAADRRYEFVFKEGM